MASRGQWPLQPMTLRNRNKSSRLSCPRQNVAFHTIKRVVRVRKLIMNPARTVLLGEGLDAEMVYEQAIAGSCCVHVNLAEEVVAC